MESWNTEVIDPYIEIEHSTNIHFSGVPIIIGLINRQDMHGLACINAEGFQNYVCFTLINIVVKQSMYFTLMYKFEQKKRLAEFSFQVPPVIRSDVSCFPNLTCFIHPSLQSFKMNVLHWPRSLTWGDQWIRVRFWIEWVQSYSADVLFWKRLYDLHAVWPC